jgi:hypothetical protein
VWTAEAPAAAEAVVVGAGVAEPREPTAAAEEEEAPAGMERAEPPVAKAA